MWAMVLDMQNQNEVQISSSAAERVRMIAQKQSVPPMLRLSVDGGGCAGFSYKFAMAEAIEPDDAISEYDGVKLLVDSISLDLLRGSRVDFVSSLGGSSFQVTNPNAASGCGCGSSFSV
jgi:iron-sulfur cluster insertion protein